MDIRLIDLGKSQWGVHAANANYDRLGHLHYEGGLRWRFVTDEYTEAFTARDIEKAKTHIAQLNAVQNKLKGFDPTPPADEADEADEGDKSASDSERNVAKAMPAKYLIGFVANQLRSLLAVAAVQEEQSIFVTEAIEVIAQSLVEGMSDDNVDSAVESLISLFKTHIEVQRTRMRQRDRSIALGDGIFGVLASGPDDLPADMPEDIKVLLRGLMGRKGVKVVKG